MSEAVPVGLLGKVDKESMTGASFLAPATVSQVDRKVLLPEN